VLFDEVDGKAELPLKQPLGGGGSYWFSFRNYVVDLQWS
jgi:hypothetical protein